MKILFTLNSESVSNETIDGSTGSNADLDIKDSLSSKEGNQGNNGGGKTNGGSSLVENLDQANAEIERLRKLYDKASGELQGKIWLFVKYMIKRFIRLIFKTNCSLLNDEAFLYFLRYLITSNLRRDMWYE